MLYNIYGCFIISEVSLIIILYEFLNDRFYIEDMQELI